MAGIANKYLLLNTANASGATNTHTSEKRSLPYTMRQERQGGLP